MHCIRIWIWDLDVFSWATHVMHSANFVMGRFVYNCLLRGRTQPAFYPTLLPASTPVPSSPLPCPPQIPATFVAGLVVYLCRNRGALHLPPNMQLHEWTLATPSAPALSCCAPPLAHWPTPACRCPVDCLVQPHPIECPIQGGAACSNLDTQPCAKRFGSLEGGGGRWVGQSAAGVPGP